MAVLGLGLAAVGRPAYLTSGRDRDLPAGRSRDALRRRAHEVLDTAYELGVRYVDAARSYGEAEDFLGSWLATGRGPDVLVASKWGYRYVGGWRLDAAVHEVKSHDRDTFEAQLAESLARLGDRLRVYQVHSVTPDSPLLTDRPLLERLAELPGQGIEVGVSTSGPRQAEAIEQVLDLTVAGRRLVTSVQATWNLLEPSAGPALAAAHAAGVRVVVKEALANGRLLDGRLDAVARRLGVGADAVALGAVRAQPWCDVVLSGAVTTAQVAANLVELPADPDLPDLAEPPDAYWATRSERPWT